MKLDIFLIILILIFAYYHYNIQNDLEKIFFKKYFGYDNIKRPLKKCQYENADNLLCYGMPSGHAETITILTYLLYYYKFIPLWLCFLLIFLFCLQRITANMHTLPQVIIGILFGYLYSNIYTYFNLSIYSFLIVASIGLTLYFLSFT
jgi:membrane-associated phospholipid phosphatase